MCFNEYLALPITDGRERKRGKHSQEVEWMVGTIYYFRTCMVL